MAGQQHPDVAIQSRRYVLGLTKALSRWSEDAQKLCDEALASASTAGEFGLHSRALLAAAEAALAAKERTKSPLARDSSPGRFARGGQLESEWRDEPLSRALTRY